MSGKSDLEVPRQIDAATPIWEDRLRRYADLIGVLATLAVSLILGYRLLGSNVSLPEDNVALFAPFSTFAHLPIKNWILTDVVQDVYPNRVFVNHALQSGQFPLWNPYILTGHPASADSLYSVFYPSTFIFGLFSPARALNLEMLTHLIIAALGMYVLVRVWSGRPLGATVAAAAFAGCSTLTVWQQYGNLFNCSVWLPWLIACFALAQGTRRLLWLGAGGIALGLVFLANDVQWLLYDLFFLACYAVYLSIQSARQGSRRFWGRPLFDISVFVDFVIMCILGFAIGAVQFVPEYVLANASGRTQGSYDYAKVYIAPLERLLTVIAPNFYGTPVHLGSEWLGKSNYPETMIFWGVFPLLIALTAPLWRRASLTWFLWGFLLLAGSMIFGTPTLHLYALIPGLNALEIGRMAYLLSFVGAALCGLCLDRIFERMQTWQPLLVVGGLAVFARLMLHVALLRSAPPANILLGPTQESIHWVTFVAIIGVILLAVPLLPMARRAIRHPLRRIAALLFALLIVADVAHFALPYNAATVPESAVFPHIALLDSIPKEVLPSRVVPIQAKDSFALLPPSMLAVYGFSDMQGYQPFVIPSYQQYFRQIEPNPFKYEGYMLLITDDSSPLLDLAGVQYFISATPLDISKKQLELLGSDQGIYLYRNPSAAPRAFVVTDARAADSLTTVWQDLKAPGWLPCQFAVVQNAPPLSPLAGSVPGCSGSATVTRYEANDVYVRAETPQDGLLVLTEAYENGWEVTVDGVRQPVVETDGAFRGVRLPAGLHDVHFAYRPPLTFRCLAISLVGLVTALILIMVGARHHGAPHPTIAPENPIEATASDQTF